MLDIRWISDNQESFKKAMKNRGVEVNVPELLFLYEAKKKAQANFDQLRAHQNSTSKEIAKLQKEKKDASVFLKEMQEVAAKIKDLQAKDSNLEDQLKQNLLVIPNVPQDDVPVAGDVTGNKEIKKWGEPPTFNFKPRQHWEIGEKLGILDFERGVKIAGARFTLYRGIAAKLERALINFMLEEHTKAGYEEVLPPFLVNAASLLGTGQLPKFEADLFKTTTNHYLVPTAEVPVTNIYRDEILNGEKLPVKMCAYTPCFRSEAGSYGQDVKGLIRQHQFNKVELVQLVTPEKSIQALENLTQDAENILQKLNLSYRVVVLCTGDMGFGSAKTYDIEVWLPGQNTYREISSCTNFCDFQARRLNLRYKDVATKKNQYVHTLNGSGLAVGRTLVAILENYQKPDGSFDIPNALNPYL